MRATYLLSILLTTCTGAPTPQAKVFGIQKAGDCPNVGTPGNFYICYKPDFQDCEYQLWTSACFTPFQGRVIKSIGPDAGGHCTLHKDKECKSDAIRYRKSDKDWDM